METDFYILLKNDLLKRLGKKHLNSRDCNTLSSEIEKEVNRQISSSTIKRFFGIVKSRFNPSKYTLDTFSLFLNYKNWENYLENSRLPEPNLIWENLKSEMEIITCESLSSLKKKTGFDEKRIFLRDFAKKRFEDFMESDKNVLMFIAPNGFGKSSLLIQLVQQFFLEENAKYQKDAIGLVDGELIFNMITNKTNLPFLQQFFEFNFEASPGRYFTSHPERRKGRICWIIDHVDEIFSEQIRYHRLVENIAKIVMTNNHPWFKLIFTLQPENLDPFISQISKIPVLKSCWFDPGFMDDNPAGNINIPYFEKDEIERMLQRHKFPADLHNLLENNKNIAHIIGFPYLLFLYLDELEHGHSDASEFTLLDKYLHRKLNSLPYREEKIRLIERFLKLSLKGKKSYAVEKTKLLANPDHIAAYEDLVSTGVFYEFSEFQNFLQINTLVRFRLNFVFEYIIFEKWTTGRLLDTALFFEIHDYYKDQQQLLCNLLNFFIRTLICRHQNDIIVELHNEIARRFPLIKSISQIPKCMKMLITTIMETFSVNSELRADLAPWISHSELGKIFYPHSDEE